MVRYYWLHRVKKIFKQHRLEWSDNNIMKPYLRLINEHINVSTASSSQFNISPTYQLNSTHVVNKSIKY